MKAANKAVQAAKATTETKAAPIRKTAKDKKKKQRAAGFVNWMYEYVSKTGEKKQLKSNRGFAIFLDGEYVDSKEAWLIDAAKSKGGVLELPVTLRIVLNSEADAVLFDEVVLPE